jgi:hypothetical protein
MGVFLYKPRARNIYIYKAPVPTVDPRHFFTNNPSQLFQINPMHACRWPNGGPAQARRLRATTLAQARHADLLTVSGQPVSPSAHLIKSASARARHPWATTLAQARHVNLLTVSGQPVSPSAHLIKTT